MSSRGSANARQRELVSTLLSLEEAPGASSCSDLREATFFVQEVPVRGVSPGTNEQTMGNLASSPSPPGLNATERWESILELTQNYIDYLASKGGIVTTADTRLRVARMTIAALEESSSAEALPKEACLLPNAKIYQLLKKDHHQEPLDHLIHSVIHHQSRLDPDWYKETMDSLKSSSKGLIDSAHLEGKTDQQVECYYYCLFIELLSVITCTHCLHMVTIMKSDDTPPPTIPAVASKDATPPSYFDWTKVFLSGDQGPTTNATVATMPYLLADSLDLGNGDFVQLVPDEGDRSALAMGMNPLTPNLCMTWSPVDYLWINRINCNLYIDLADFFSPHKPLSPTTRCAAHYTRRDIETVALAVSDGYSCDF